MNHSLWAWCLLLAALSSCSTLNHPGGGTSNIPFHRSSHAVEPKLIWTHASKGPVTDLKLASRSGEVVYAEIPDPDFPNGPSSPRLVRLKRDGSQQWVRPLSSKVKEFDLSADGDRLAVTTYDEKVEVYDSHGRVLWAAQQFCHPILLSQQKK